MAQRPIERQPHRLWLMLILHALLIRNPNSVSSFSWQFRPVSNIPLSLVFGSAFTLYFSDATLGVREEGREREASLRV